MSVLGLVALVLLAWVLSVEVRLYFLRASFAMQIKVNALQREANAHVIFFQKQTLAWQLEAMKHMGAGMAGAESTETLQ